MKTDRAWSWGVVLVLASAASMIAVAQVPARAYAGLGLADAPGAAGAVVGVVAPAGPAALAGVEVEDVVTSVNGSPVPNAVAATDALRAMSPGDRARLTVLRGRGSEARRVSIVLTLAAPAGEGGNMAPQASTGNAAKPINVGGYTRFEDPLEHAFTMEVPADWHTVGGLARRSALQINPFLRSLSPDETTYLLIGEPTLPSYVPPTPMRNALGYREGKMFDSGLGGLSMVLHFMSGGEFARSYGQTVLASLCRDVRFRQSVERPDMAQSADQLVPTPIPSQSSGGEARFSCTHHGHHTEARIEAVTRTTRDNVMWNVIFLKGFLASSNEADKAEEILTRVGGSFKFDPAWLQKQSNLDQQAAAAINQRMRDFFRQEQGVIQKLNALDDTFSAMDEIVSGYSTYHDAATGNDFKLGNTDPYKWIDNSTGRIFSTPDAVPPNWAGNLSALTHVAQ
jgi:hypothetical protein